MDANGKALTEPSILNNRTEKIFKYVEAYNEMNVESMITDLLMAYSS
ncbi:hypothetical protein [Sphingobacterium sp. 18053]|nr:hypothetical protein [Sphingobacterium sp. 18053]